MRGYQISPALVYTDGPLRLHLGAETRCANICVSDKRFVMISDEEMGPSPLMILYQTHIRGPREAGVSAPSAVSTGNYSNMFAAVQLFP